jgi:hypothetical protein
VDLRDRGGGDRRVVEAREQRVDRLAELELDGAPRLGAGKRRQVVLQLGPRSVATSSLSRSARVDSAWPSLMKLGPISCSAAASRSPGRRESRRTANSRAQAISAGRDAEVSSGNSAVVAARSSGDPQQAPAVAQGAQHA